MRKRTSARQLALEILYHLDMNGLGNIKLDELEKTISKKTKSEEIRSFAAELVNGYQENRKTIDKKIEDASHNWSLERMAIIDRNILRLATYELLYKDDIPALVTINEAIELAKKFSARKSGSFVNGVLDNLRRKYSNHKPVNAKVKQAP